MEELSEVFVEKKVLIPLWSKVYDDYESEIL